MKKLFLSAACALTLFAVACSSSPEKQVENMIDKYTTKVEQAKSADDLTKIYADFMEDAMALEKKYPDFDPENNEALEAKIEKFQDALEAKAEELAGDLFE